MQSATRFVTRDPGTQQNFLTLCIKSRRLWLASSLSGCTLVGKVK
jgi:hypothetical protein